MKPDKTSGTNTSEGWTPIQEGIDLRRDDPKQKQGCNWQGCLNEATVTEPDGYSYCETHREGGED